MAQRKVGLECTKCGARNYTVTVKPTREQRLELKKFVNIVVNIPFIVKLGSGGKQCIYLDF